jgi:hypothetical protein
MNLPTLDDARRLAEWAPPLGVVSVYLRLDPGDRGGAWRTELHNGLAGVLDADGLDHDAAAALRATAGRIGDRFANHERGLSRGEVGFVEVAAKQGSERWWSTHLLPDPAAPAALDARPLVAPLVCLLERSSRRGVVLLSAERVRVLEWSPGRLEEVHGWELSVFSEDWRERKAQRVADPARGQALSAPGRDQFDERLAENRHRFLVECGRLAAQLATERGWPQLVLFGAAEHRRELCQGLPAPSIAAGGDDADLISEPLGRLGEPIAEAVERLDAAREHELAARALDEARGGTRGAAGRQETEAALAEARVECLVVDAARSAASEPLVRRALESGAGVAAVSGAAAELLASVEGVAALLRY